ncbi:hypothetical protein M5D96_007338 [Drosophila gunungcola]|uniref:Uncharacterized protein n=1 Tax=Drosophila gunungcola TaxID=103775 RepID=A0A9P9YND0_9MUSC|nr:hypothetical protein M5D96_007338 [Drosophila gunungcola]
MEETFAQQLDEMETLYGGTLIVSMPSDTLQRDHFTGSTRSSLSSRNELSRQWIERSEGGGGEQEQKKKQKEKERQEQQQD